MICKHIVRPKLLYRAGKIHISKDYFTETKTIHRKMITFVSNLFLHCLLIVDFLYDFFEHKACMAEKLEFFECLYCESILYHTVL